MSDPNPFAPLAAELAAALASIAAAEDGGRSASAALYRALQAAGLPEPAAADLAHQIHRAAQAAPAPAVRLSGAAAPAGNLTTTENPADA